MERRSFAPAWFMGMAAASAGLLIYGVCTNQICTDSSSNAINGRTETNISAKTTVGLHNQLWIDKVPESGWDSYNIYIFIKKGQKLGLQITAESSFKQILEIFEYKDKTAGELQFHFPHDGTRAVSSYVLEDLPTPDGPFTTKLILNNDPKNDNKTSVYYSGPEFSTENYQNSQLPEKVKLLVKSAVAEK